MKHVFIASVGGAPQVVTETLWALMHPHKMLSADSQGRDPVVPGEIIMFTTAFKGLGNTFASKKERLEMTRDKIVELYRQYGHPPPKFSPSPALVVRGPDGKELQDIRDAEENACFADAVVTVMTGLTKRRRREDLILHVSLAGGRKTMSSYLHWAMITFGTGHDELTHVLVENTNLESAGDFWWPDQAQKLVYSHVAKQELSTDAQMDARGNIGDAARLDLVRVPFDPLGRTVPDIDRRYANFADLMAYQEWERAGEPIIFHLKSHAITVAGKRMVIHNAAFAVLFVAAKARKERWTSPYDNQIPGLEGRILAYDIRYGLDHLGKPRDSKARQAVDALYKYWWESTPQEERFGRSKPTNFIVDSEQLSPPKSGEKDGSGVKDALGDLNRELKNLATSHYLPEALREIKHKVVRKTIELDGGYKMSMNHFGLDFDPDRIDFRDD